MERMMTILIMITVIVFAFTAIQTLQITELAASIKTTGIISGSTTSGGSALSGATSYASAPAMVGGC